MPRHWLDALLEAWAREVRDSGPSGISLLGHIGDLGPDGALIRTTAAVGVPEWDDKTHAVECAVLKLPWHYAGAIVQRYVIRPNVVDEVRARYLNVKLGTYRHWCRTALSILAEELREFEPLEDRLARRA